MIGSFSQYLVEEEKTVFFTFGRMNPPTTGHGKLLDTLSASAGRNPYRVYLTQTVDGKKNPIPYKDKVKFARKMFPKHARNILLSNNIKTVYDVLTQLYNEGFRKIVMVVGSDRVNEFNAIINNYNGKKAKHGFYNFMSIKVLSAGQRDADSDDIDGMSATKMRGFASDNDFTTFSQALPKAFSNSDSKSLFNSVRRGLGLKEETSFKRHIELMPVSDIRESYIDGKLFEVGDSVVIKENGEIGQVKRLGSNYVIIESKSNKYRKWLDAVEKIDQPTVEYDVAPFSMNLSEAVDNTKSMYSDKPDWGTPESTKNAKKKTPGEKFSFKNFDESSATDLAKKRINREKRADAVRHDRMMDRARLKQTIIKNRETKPND